MLFNDFTTDGEQSEIPITGWMNWLHFVDGNSDFAELAQSFWADFFARFGTLTFRHELILRLHRFALKSKTERVALQPFRFSYAIESNNIEVM